MWIANCRLLEFINIETGMKLEISNDRVSLSVPLATGEGRIDIIRLPGYEIALKMYKYFLEVFKRRGLLLCEFEE